MPLAVVACLEFLLRSGRLDTQLVFRPQAVALALMQMFEDGSLTRNTAQTFSSAFIGWAAGCSLGLLAGLGLGQSRALVHGARLWAGFLLGIPSVMLIPVAMLVIGFGNRMETTVVAVSCFLPMLLQVTAAFASADRRLDPLAKVLHLSRLQRAVLLVSPVVLPAIGRGLRLCAVVGFLTAITIEVAANPQGLGYAVVVAQQTLRSEVMFALLVWIGAIALALQLGFAWLQRYLYSLYTAAQQRAVG